VGASDVEQIARERERDKKIKREREKERKREREREREKKIERGTGGESNITYPDLWNDSLFCSSRIDSALRQRFSFRLSK
jgi:hypothetical protein